MARITLIDDQLSVRVAVRAMLEAGGHEVTDFESARKALRHLDSGCDLVVTDVVMPEMDGLEVLSYIRERRPELPVLVITGGWSNSGVDLLSVAERLGATRSLPKSSLAADLLPVIEAMIAGGTGAEASPA